MVGVLAAIAAVVLVAALFRLFDSASAPPIVIADPPGPAAIVVAVEGAVATPGLYRLPGDARHGDAIAAAGGLAADADRALVNPARRLRDEERFVVPSRTETEPTAPSAPTPRAAEAETAAPAAPTRVAAAAETAADAADPVDNGGAAPAPAVAPPVLPTALPVPPAAPPAEPRSTIEGNGNSDDGGGNGGEGGGDSDGNGDGAGPIDINVASAADLDALPGIGPVLAERIVALRSERGSFRSVEELEQVQGISARMVDEIRPLVTVGG